MKMIVYQEGKHLLMKVMIKKNRMNYRTLVMMEVSYIKKDFKHPVVLSGVVRFVQRWNIKLENATRHCYRQKYINMKMHDLSTDQNINATWTARRAHEGRYIVSFELQNCDWFWMEPLAWVEHSRKTNLFKLHFEVLIRCWIRHCPTSTTVKSRWGSGQYHLSAFSDHVHQCKSWIQRNTQFTEKLFCYSIYYKTRWLACIMSTSMMIRLFHPRKLLPLLRRK